MIGFAIAHTKLYDRHQQKITNACIIYVLRWKMAYHTKEMYIYIFIGLMINANIN